MKTIRGPRRAAGIIVLAVILICLVVLCIKLKELHDADRKYDEIANTIGSEDNFGELAENNPEVVAWLSVDGTQIDLPGTQGKDNIKYVNTDVRGNSSFAGNPFLDCRNDPGFTDVYSIIYGHDMEDHLMFGDLDMFLDESFWEGPRVGKLRLTDGRTFEISFFAVVKTVSSDSRFMDPLMVRNNWERDFLDEMTASALIAKDRINDKDRIIALSTCESAGSDERIVLLGKILK